jgi:MFS transporter, FHS family, L-fucose permease
MMTALVGGAVIPLAIGALAGKVGIQPSFLIPVVCFL